MTDRTTLLIRFFKSETKKRFKVFCAESEVSMGTAFEALLDLAMEDKEILEKLEKRLRELK